MKVLIADDEYASRLLLKELLSAVGECTEVGDGQEAVDAFEIALEDGDPYDLICLDIMMPNLDGQQALQRIREMERNLKIRTSEEVVIFMTSALNRLETVVASFKQGGCSAYLTKPITRNAIEEKLKKYGLVS